MKRKQTNTPLAPATDNSATSGMLETIIGNPWYSCFMFAVVCFLIYSNSFDCSFQFDDTGSIVNNSRIKSFSNVSELWQKDRSRIVPYLTFMLNYQLGGLNVWGYHLVNITLHLLNACLVGWLIKLIFSTPSIRKSEAARFTNEISFFAALLFVVHPLATQSVTYIVQRMASLATLFYLFSVAAYLKGRLSESTLATRYLMYGIAFVSAVLAFFTKENSFTLPLAILLCEFFFFPSENHETRRDRSKFYLFVGLSVLAAGLVFSTFTMEIFKSVPPSHGNEYTVTSLNYFLTQPSVILKYIRLLFLPVQQNVDYYCPPVQSLMEPKAFFSFLVLAAILYYAVRVHKKHPIISFSIFWFFLTISVESGIIPIEDLMFEHRTYLPSLGFFLLLTYGGFQVIGQQKIKMLGAIFLSLAAIFSVMTYQRNQVWKNPISLWTDVTIKSPLKARPYGSLGEAYLSDGQLQNALKAYVKSAELSPRYGTAHRNVGAVYSKLQQWDLAYSSYSKAIDCNQDDRQAYFDRATAAYTSGKNTLAISDFNIAIEKNKEDKMARYGRGSCYLKLGKITEAISDFSAAIAIDPNFTDAYYYSGTLYMQARDWKNAAENFEKVVSINPEYKGCWFNLSVCHSTLKNWNRAFEACTECIKREPAAAPAYIIRGVAAINSGKWKAAVDNLTEALRLNPGNVIATQNLALAKSKLQSAGG